MNYSNSIFLLGLLVLISCGNQNESENRETILVPAEAKAYWYSGEAEITSFNLKQSRYGEIRDGKAVMIFVTEDFSKSEFTKVDKSKKEAVSVLKMNFTKNFITGIYPYSIMTSSFVPFENYDPVLKISTSVQEWCGHVYMELVRKKQFDYLVHSYFEDENVVDGQLKITLAEDEIWNQIRIFPETISEGKAQVIPSFSYLRLLHKEMKAYDCEISKTETDSNQTILSLYYAELERTLKITYQSEFPRQIIRWEETYPDGFGEEKKMITSVGERIKIIRSDYWSKNKSIDQPLRKELGLE